MSTDQIIVSILVALIGLFICAVFLRLLMAYISSCIVTSNYN